MFLSHWMTNTNTRIKLQISSATWQSKPGSLCPNSFCWKLEKSSFLKLRFGNSVYFLAEENNILETASAVEDYVKLHGQILKYRVWCLALFIKDILAGLNIWIHLNLDINLFNLEIIYICDFAIILASWLFMMTRLPSPQNDYLCCKPVQLAWDKHTFFVFSAVIFLLRCFWLRYNTYCNCEY